MCRTTASPERAREYVESDPDSAPIWSFMEDGVNICVKAIEMASERYESGKDAEANLAFTCNSEVHRSNAMAEFLEQWLETHGVNVVVISHYLRETEAAWRHGLRDMCGCEENACRVRTRDTQFNGKPVRVKNISQKRIVRLLEKTREGLGVAPAAICRTAVGIRLLKGDELKAPPCMGSNTPATSAAGGSTKKLILLGAEKVEERRKGSKRQSEEEGSHY